MSKKPLLTFIKQLRRPIFTTHEVCALSGRSSSAVVQALNNLAENELVFKIYRGIWAETGKEKVSPYSVAPFLFPKQRAYVSFISAMHLHGMLEQIPQIITLASTVHTKTIHTKLGVFHIHKISPVLFGGFTWYKEKGDFLIATPEKALIDALYLSACKKKQFNYFPELYLTKEFDIKKAKYWLNRIANDKTRIYVHKKLDPILLRKKGKK